MCSGAILPKLLQFSLPLMCSSILQLLFNAADIIVVGRYAGDNSLAAVGSNAALINLLVNLFMGLSIGSNILAARCCGAGDEDGLSKTVHTSILLALLSGLALAVIGVICAIPILRLMQAPSNILNLAAVYLRIYFLGMPATMLYNFGAALLRAVGDTRRPLYFLTCSGILNVALNLYFVIVWHMDVAGVALATVISQCLSAILVVGCLMREKGAVHLDLHKLKLDPLWLRQILRIGVPAGLQGVAFSLSNVVIQSAVNGFGEIVIAGNAAASNIEGFIYVAINSFYQANVAFTSQNLGAGKIGRIRRIFCLALACGMTTGIVCGGLAVLFAPQLLHIYSPSDAVVEAGVARMSIVCLTYALCGLMDVIVGTIRGVGYSVLPMIVTVVGACGLRILWIATVFQIPQFHTVQTVYWSYPISWLITFLAHLLCCALAARCYKKTGSFVYRRKGVASAQKSLHR